MWVFSDSIKVWKRKPTKILTWILAIRWNFTSEIEEKDRWEPHDSFVIRPLANAREFLLWFWINIFRLKCFLSYQCVVCKGFTVCIHSSMLNESAFDFHIYYHIYITVVLFKANDTQIGYQIGRMLISFGQVFLLHLFNELLVEFHLCDWKKKKKETNEHDFFPFLFLTFYRNERNWDLNTQFSRGIVMGYDKSGKIKKQLKLNE